jgi:hypothetical protein
MIDATDSYANIKALLRPKEPIYISTDEKDEQFFDVFRQNGHRVIRWPEVHTAYLRSVHVPWKLTGLIEQVICACGRVFIGTDTSTFSSHIYTLRGYMHIHAEQTFAQFHTSQAPVVTWGKYMPNNSTRRQPEHQPQYHHHSPLERGGEGMTMDDVLAPKRRAVVDIEPARWLLV